MAFRRWSRDVLSAVHESVAGRYIPDSWKRRVVQFALWSTYAPRPLAGNHREATRAFERFLELSVDQAEGHARDFSDTSYRAGILTWMLSMLDSREIRSWTARNVRVEGELHFREALSRGPVIVFSGHYGLPIATALKVAQLLDGSRTLNTFFAPPEENPATTGLREIFERSGFRVSTLAVSARATIQAIRALTKGEVLTMQPDVYDTRSGSALAVPFLNGATYAMAGTAYIALKSGAQLLPAHSVVDRRGRVTVSFHPAVPFCPTGDFTEDCAALTEAVYAEIERAIRVRPDQWVYWQSLADRMVPNVRIAPDERENGLAWWSACQEFCYQARAHVPFLGHQMFTTADTPVR